VYQDIKIKGSFLLFAEQFCKNEAIIIKPFSKKINNEELYEFDLLLNLLEEFRIQKKLSLIEKLGKAYFKEILDNDNDGDFKTISSVKEGISKMYKLYQTFLIAERHGVWKPEESINKGFIKVKENTPMPAMFTKGVLFALTEFVGCQVVRVKIDEEISDNNTFNIYEISWMNKITN